jgi:hypothetical protein
MDQPDPHIGHTHDPGSDGLPLHSHIHGHGPASPHPAQAVSWSILRMTVGSRLGAALVVSACLWAIVWLAMR